MRFHVHVWLLLLLLPAVLPVLCCAAGAAGAFGQGCWVYFGTFTGGMSKGIYVSRMDAAGNVTVPELAVTCTNPAFLAMDPGRRFLYAVNEVDNFGGRAGGAVSAFALDDRTGRLTPLNQQSSVGTGPCHVQVDATGRAVLVANYGGGSVAVFPVRADGSLGEARSFIQHRGSSLNPLRQQGPHGHCIVTDPDNRFALACDLGLDKVVVYKLDSVQARLTPNDPPSAPLPPGSGPRHLAFHPTGNWVYVINEMGCTVTVFRYDAARGALTEIQNVSTLPSGHAVETRFAAAEIAVHPSGKFLYGSTRGHNTIAVFNIDEQTGKLTWAEEVPSGGKTPRHFGLDPSGRFLLAANQNSDSVVIFSIDSKTGRLAATGRSLNIGSPVCVMCVPVR